MRNSLLTAVAAASLLMAASPALAKGGTWVPVNNIQNSTAMTLFGIDDSNNISGQYTDTSGAVHGFVGDFAGDKYASFDDPDGDTQPRAMNDKGYVTGFDAGAFAPWERNPKGTLSPVTRAGHDIDQVAQGINSAGNFVGDFTDVKTSLFEGYIGKNAKVTKVFTLKAKNGGYAGRAIDTAGDIGGWYYDPTTGLQRGFLNMAGSKKPTLIDYPSAQYTVVEGMNDNGIVVGQWQDASGTIHGFYYTVNTGKYTNLDPPGSTQTQVWNINNSNVITASGSAGNFVYCMQKTGCPGNGAGVVNSRPAKFTPARP
ncbi:MAG TPA: hypothetical protein VHY79_17580 [Rhizomicrobium sp.]|jgi:hypothetical protein|nr:hypothetical protein [Rhizomicrobium sp.]